LVAFIGRGDKGGCLDLGVDKSPGPDFFPVFFYRYFWDIVKPKVIRLLDDLFDSSL